MSYVEINLNDVGERCRRDRFYHFRKVENKKNIRENFRTPICEIRANICQEIPHET